jgi:hypothetical protein
MKIVIVESADWKQIIKIDNKIFDDIYVEACTRAIENLQKENKLRLWSTILCWDKKTPKKIITYNSYKILINAGFHKFANYIRNHYIKNQNIDWAAEPLRNKNDKI